MTDDGLVFGSFTPDAATPGAPGTKVTVKLPDALAKGFAEKAATSVSPESPTKPAPPAPQTTTSPSPAAAPATPSKSKPRSWAALVSPGAGSGPGPRAEPSSSGGAVKRGSARAVLAVERADLRTEGGPALPAVGLVNTGNFCYMNAVLQPLLRCPPLLRVLRQLADCSLPSDAGLLRALAELTADMQGTQPPGACVPASLAQLVAQGFAPARVGVPLGSSAQADAPEFLDWLLDRLHRDALLTAGARPERTTSRDEDEQWSAVGRRQKTAVIVSDAAAGAQSVVSACFGARVQSVVRRAGAAASMAVQPYLALPLDIASERVVSVREALAELLAREQLSGYEDRRAGATAASKQLSLASLPPVLVLLLKRYDPLTGAKSHKHVAFGRELQLQPEWLASASLAPAPAARTYRLFAVVSHHGRAGSAGHYTADVLQPDGRWLCFDDAHVAPLPEKDVLQRHAYLLFYTRQQAG